VCFDKLSMSGLGWSGEKQISAQPELVEGRALMFDMHIAPR
jgi:hypothetical protein